MKISFLLHNAYSTDETNRPVLTLAGALAARHQVEIVLVFRRWDRMIFDAPANVRVRALVDRRAGMSAQDEKPLDSASEPTSGEYFGQYSPLVNERICRHLAETTADVLIGTRPSLNLLIAQFGREGAVRLAQERMPYEAVPAYARDAYREWYPRLDASVPIARADVQAFAAAVPGLRLCAIPDGVPAAGIEPSRGTQRIVVAAGRLIASKRYDVLIQSWAKVAAAHPDWRLRIYGTGPEISDLRALVGELGLHNHVLLMGLHSQPESEWVKGSIAAVTSTDEPSGMLMVEAMRCGLPVVSTDNTIAREIVTNEADGLLVPAGDEQAFADGLLRLIEDDELRRRLGSAALASAHRYDPRETAARYEELILQAGAERGLHLRPSSGRRPGTAAGRRSTAVDRARNLAGLVVPGRLARRLGIEAALIADCTLDRDGSLLVALPAAAVPLLPLDVACRPRGDVKSLRIKRFPLTRGAQGRRVATIPAPGQPGGLTEERWDLFIAEPGGRLKRIKPGLLDTRVAAGGPEDPSAPAGIAVPYETRDGNLAVQNWKRGGRAEIEAVEIAGGSMLVRGRLPQGPSWEGGADLLLRRLVDDLELRTPCTGDDADGARFSAAVPLEAMVDRRLTRHDDWNVWLAPSKGPAKAAMRLGRFADDIAYKKSIFSYPELSLDDPFLLPQNGLPGEAGVYEGEESPYAPITVKVYYSPDNELAVYVDE